MRKPRDYKAEYAARKAKDTLRGYTVWERREAVRKGAAKALRTNAVRRSDTRAAQAHIWDWDAFVASVIPERSDETRAREWSTLFAQSFVAEYLPEQAGELGLTRAEYTHAYLDAFVEGSGRYNKNRGNGGSSAMRYWFVDLMDYLEADEFDDRYTADSG